LYDESTRERDPWVLLKLITRLPLFFRWNSRVISGPAIFPPRLLSFDYKFRNEISYSLRDPFIRHSNDVFLRSHIVPARKHVNTYGVPRALHTFRLSMCTNSSSYTHIFPVVENSGSSLLASPHRLHGAKIRAFTTSSFTRGFRKYFIPRTGRGVPLSFPGRGNLRDPISARQWELASFLHHLGNDVGRHQTIQCRLRETLGLCSPLFWIIKLEVSLIVTIMEKPEFLTLQSLFFHEVSSILVCSAHTCAFTLNTFAILRFYFKCTYRVVRIEKRIKLITEQINSVYYISLIIEYKYRFY